MTDTRSAPIPFEPETPVSEGMIPLCVPEIHGNEWKYIKECLDTNWVSSVGSYVTRFEKLVADRLDVDHAVAIVNGTAALHLALLIAGIQPDEEVLIPTLTFIAPANAIRHVGAWPVFMDVDSACWQIDISKTIDFLKRDCQWQSGALYNKITGRRVKAILPVDILGHPVDMDPILEIAHKYDLVVIEDAAESLGSKYLRNRESVDPKWTPVGSLGDIACLSFNGNKIITTGGGGMVLTNNEIWAHRARYLATQAKDDPVEYVHNEIGYNYRLTNVQAAMGVAQMELLDDHIIAKQKIATCYKNGLADISGITLHSQADWAESIFWLYTILVEARTYGVDSRTLMRKLRETGIESRPFWQPLHTLKLFKKCATYRIEVANRLHRNGLCLPSSVGLGLKEQDRVIQAIRKLGKV